MVLFSGNSVRVIHRFQRSNDPLGIGARTRLAMTLWPTLPDARERLIAKVGSVMREVSGGDVDGDLAIGNLLVRVMGAREAINIADQNRFNLERT